MHTISVVHPSLNRAGGAERYLIEMTKALQEAGYPVNLYTVDKTDWDRIWEIQGVSAKPNQEHYRREKKLEPTTILSWLRTALIYSWLLIRAREETDISINNYGEVLPIIADISIIHAVPLIAKTNNAYNIPFWEIAEPLFRYMHGFLKKKTSTQIITNSRFNEEKIRQHYDTEIKIAHPPITSIYYGERKDGTILSIARISPNKNLKMITEIANRSSRNRFVIAGKTVQNSDKVLRVLREMRNIEVHTNPPRGSLMELMKHSSILLSTQPDEAFGMAIVEAMGMGCIPVVYRGGGPWMDILDEKEGDTGYAYDNPVEATERIEQILEDDELRATLRENSLQRSRHFNEENFREKILGIVGKTEPVKTKDSLTAVYRLVKKIEGFMAP